MKIRVLIAALLLMAVPGITEPWGGVSITLTPGTAIRIVKIRTIVSSFIVQMAPTSTTGVGYVLYAPPGVTCANGGAGTTLIATLATATASSPGGNVTIPSNPDPFGGADISGYCVDGAAASPVTVAWNLRN